MKESQIAFWNECKQFIGEHKEETVVKFYCHWAEEVKGTGLMLWETKKSWNTKFRLAAWSKRSFEVNDQAANIRLQKAKNGGKLQTTNTAEQQAIAAKREQDNAKLEQEIEERKAGAVSYEEYRQMKSTQKEPSLMCKKL